MVRVHRRPSAVRTGTSPVALRPGPGAGDSPPGNNDPISALKRLGHVFGMLAPHSDGRRWAGCLPTHRFVAPPAVDRDRGAGGRSATRRRCGVTGGNRRGRRGSGVRGRGSWRGQPWTAPSATSLASPAVSVGSVSSVSSTCSPQARRSTGESWSLTEARNRR